MQRKKQPGAVPFTKILCVLHSASRPSTLASEVYIAAFIFSQANRRDAKQKQYNFAYIVQTSTRRSFFYKPVVSEVFYSSHHLTPKLQFRGQPSPLTRCWPNAVIVVTKWTRLYFKTLHQCKRTDLNFSFEICTGLHILFYQASANTNFRRQFSTILYKGKPFPPFLSHC